MWTLYLCLISQLEHSHKAGGGWGRGTWNTVMKSLEIIYHSKSWSNNWNVKDLWLCSIDFILLGELLCFLKWQIEFAIKCKSNLFIYFFFFFLRTIFSVIIEIFGNLKYKKMQEKEEAFQFFQPFHCIKDLT